MADRDADYKLAGLVKIDDAYFGGPSEGSDKSGRGTEKVPVIVAVSVDDNDNPVYARMEVVETIDERTAKSFALKHVVFGPLIRRTIIWEGGFCLQREFFIVDVFAQEKYAGNQLAVFTDGHLYSDAEMQKLAAEMHFSETTFIFPRESSGCTFKTRIFTPAAEVPFAGHPTLGTAYVIVREILKRQVEEVVLDLPAGAVPVRVAYDGAGEIESLTMKQLPPRFGPVLEHGAAASLLGLPATEVDDRFPVEEVSTGLPFLIVPLRTLSGIRSARVNRAELDRVLDRFAFPAVLAFCPETCDGQNAFHVRVFVDLLGVPEDPATGSGAGCLTGYLLRHGYLGTDRIDITVEQGYEVGRPSLLRLAGNVDDGVFHVFVGGKVFPVARGYLL